MYSLPAFITQIVAETYALSKTFSVLHKIIDAIGMQFLWLYGNSTHIYLSKSSKIMHNTQRTCYDIFNLQNRNKIIRFEGLTSIGLFDIIIKLIAERKASVLELADRHV